MSIPLALAVDPTVIIGGIAGLATLIYKLDKRNAQFRRDWEGEQERPGVPRRPGVLERLQDQDEQLAFLRHELSFNSGRSVKDEVSKMAQAMRAKGEIQ